MELHITGTPSDYLAVKHQGRLLAVINDFGEVETRDMLEQEVMEARRLERIPSTLDGLIHNFLVCETHEEQVDFMEGLADGFKSDEPPRKDAPESYQLAYDIGRGLAEMRKSETARPGKPIWCEPLKASISQPQDMPPEGLLGSLYAVAAEINERMLDGDEALLCGYPFEEDFGHLVHKLRAWRDAA